MLVILGNQLFPLDHLPPPDVAPVFMAEDVGLCTYVKHHQQKIVLFLAAMRAYADELRDADYEVHYVTLDSSDTRPYEDKLAEAMQAAGAERLPHFDIEDWAMEQRIVAIAESEDIEREVLDSPMFTCSREEFAEFLRGKSRLVMGDFYKQQRRRLGVLVDKEGEPVGGRWSFDEDNRKKLPRSITSPDIPAPNKPAHVEDVIRLVEREFGERQESENFWSHEHELAASWYEGTTGIVPLDDTIQNARRLGWTHHIPRLMVVANLMTLSEIRPTTAHRWFMEMYVDSSEWVMGPNVYGMGLYSDGGIFATKPYICGSSYLLRMSDYKKGPWCDVVDGLYWRFIDKHREFFASNPRLALMPRALNRLDDDRRKCIFAAAESFLAEHTRS